MRKSVIVAALAVLALAGCANAYVAGDVGARRVAEPAHSR